MRFGGHGPSFFARQPATAAPVAPVAAVALARRLAGVMYGLAVGCCGPRAGFASISDMGEPLSAATIREGQDNGLSSHHRHCPVSGRPLGLLRPGVIVVSRPARLFSAFDSRTARTGPPFCHPPSPTVCCCNRLASSRPSIYDPFAIREAHWKLLSVRDTVREWAVGARAILHLPLCPLQVGGSSKCTLPVQYTLISVAKRRLHDTPVLT